METPQVRGDQIGKITTHKKFKTFMLNMFKGYPAYEYYGIIETYFPDKLGERVINVLEKDQLIEVDKTRLPNKYYRLAPRGIDVAVSFISLDYSQKMLNLTKAVIGLSILTLLCSVSAFFLA
jgi:hypothetical protein